MICPTDPPQKNQKNPEKNPSKGHPRALTLLELKKNFQISFSQYANNVGTPLFRSMCQAQNTDTHALNQQGLSQNSLLLSSNFTADKHIWPPLSLDVKVMNKSFIIALLKMSKNK